MDRKGVISSSESHMRLLYIWNLTSAISEALLLQPPVIPMGRVPFSRFVVEQWHAVPELEKQDLSGQTVLVVGASIGLGLEAAKHLARMGPGKLVVACRSIKKAEDAAKGASSSHSRSPIRSRC